MDSELVGELKPRSRKSLPNFNVHHKVFFVPLSNFARGLKFGGGWKLFEDKKNFEDFLAIIAEYGGTAEAGLEKVSLDVINQRVGLLLNSKKYGEIFYYFFNHFFS